MLTPNEINDRLNVLEFDMNRLVAENERLKQERNSAYVELISCVGLLTKVAIKQGLKAGTTEHQQVVLDLPIGQVSWEFEASEAHLFEELPKYTEAIEEISIKEKYIRIMNPKLSS